MDLGRQQRSKWHRFTEPPDALLQWPRRGLCWEAAPTAGLSPSTATSSAPVPNVYICDSGTHPGPGVSMGSGYNAARVISQDFGLTFPATGQA